MTEHHTKTVAQATAVDLMLGERCYQDEKWGGAANDAEQAQEDWARYITEYANGTGRAASYDFMTRMRKAGALAMAAMEAEIKAGRVG